MSLIGKMAEQQEHKTHVKDRVRIKSSVTHMYPEARAYNEGWVRDHMHDHLGYPLIFIEWDKDHWAYSGEEDRWVMESHFDLVEDGMPEDRFDSLLNGLSDLLSSFREESGGDEPKEDFNMAVPKGDHDMSYNEVLDKAMEEAANAEAFIVITAMPETFAGKDLLIPHIYMHFKRDDAAMMLDATMADAAAQAHARLVLSVIERAKRDGSSGS